MRRLLLTLRYDGTNYHGWQVQKNACTVQQTLQDAAEAVLGARPGITGCSRTDAGVHAEMFCAHLDTASAIPCERLPAALNAHLPRDIAVYGCREVAPDFHARYACRGKTYRYQFYNGAVRNPFYEGRALHVHAPLDADLLARAAGGFTGTHDFRGFCAAGSSVEDTVRTVPRAAVTREGELVVFRVTADGFLYNMVRIMAGTLLAVAAGELAPQEVAAVVASGDRLRAGKTAPAYGLYLERVYYDLDKEGR